MNPASKSGMRIQTVEKEYTSPDEPPQPSWRVLKFGGTSVSTASSWKNIRRIVEESLGCGIRPLLVCSALSGISNLLEETLRHSSGGPGLWDLVRGIEDRHLKLGRELEIEAKWLLAEDLARLLNLLHEARRHDRTPPRVWAEAMATGELLSTRLGAAYLNRVGLGGTWIDARELLVSAREPDSSGPSEDYLSASCHHNPDEALTRGLASVGGPAWITQGFIASNENGETVLLGRGGSDTSAACLASRLEADRLEVWTDVPGVFTTNPNEHDDARLLRTLTHAEAETIAFLGGKVLHPRSLEPLRTREIPLSMGWTRRPEVKGTRVVTRPDTDEVGIKSVISRKKLCLVSMRREPTWQPVSFMSEVASCFGNRGLSMDLVASSPEEIRATIDLSAYPELGDSLDGLIQDLARVCEPELRRDVGSVSLVGTEVGGELPRVAMALEALGDTELHLVSHAANDRSVSYVADADRVDELCGLLHRELVRDREDHPLYSHTWKRLQEEPGGDGGRGFDEIRRAAA